MPAGDGDGGAALHQGRELLLVAQDLFALVDLHSLFEVSADVVAVADMPSVQRTDGLDAGGLDLVADGGGGVVGGDVALGHERVLEADPIDVLKVPQQVLPLAVGGGELGVGGEELVAASVEVEVGGVTAKVRAELVVLGLTLLPAGGDEGDGPIDPELGYDGAQGGLEALGAKEDCGSHGTHGAASYMLVVISALALAIRTRQSRT